MRKKELAILIRTERATCKVEMMDRKNTNELMDKLELYETLDKMAKANGVRRYGHALRREDVMFYGRHCNLNWMGRKREKDQR